MRKILGALLMVSGIVLGLYFGVWVMFIGGIVDLLNQINDVASGDINSLEIALGVIKMMFASLVGTICGAIPAIGGFLVFSYK